MEKSTSVPVQYDFLTATVIGPAPTPLGTRKKVAVTRAQHRITYAPLAASNFRPTSVGRQLHAGHVPLTKLERGTLTINTLLHPPKSWTVARNTVSDPQTTHESGTLGFDPFCTTSDPGLKLASQVCAIQKCSS